MNVAIFTDTFLPKIDGVAISVDHFCRYLSASGHKFIICCPKYGSDDIKVLGDDIEILRELEEIAIIGLVARPPATFPVTVELVDDALFVRAYYGVASRWHQAAMRQKAGRISAAGQTFEVAFERLAPDDALQARIDDAYRAKYASSSYLGSMISDRARAATVRVVLRAE